ncbi:MAG: DUF6056 family protein [Bacteroides sp.]|nr:DUF6056 family protein [Eubacterium sp.]MCM1418730.1 DUF6056 family protein [Roseburia sp.]MCM1462797.1 DUF6056 family protein [Bacteroides sp.]
MTQLKPRTDKTRDDRLGAAIVLFSCLLFFLYMLILTARCPYVSDDYHFKFVWLDFTPCGFDRRIGGLPDIFESMANYYRLSGGRVLCHFLGYLLLWFDKGLFNVLNALVFVALGLLLSETALAGRRLVRCPALLPLTLLFLFFYLPQFGDNVLWLSGSVNYLWSSALLIAAVFVSERHFRSPTAGSLAATCLLVLLSSFTNEITGGMLIVLFLLRSLFGKGSLRDRLLPPLFALPGIVFVVTAPGNAARSAAIEEVPFLSPSEILPLIPKYLSFLFSNTMYILFLLLLLLRFVVLTRREGVKRAIFETRFFLAGAAGLAALSMSGVYIRRPLMLPMALIAVDYIKAALFAYELLTRDPDRLFRRVLKDRPLSPKDKRLVSSAIKGAAVFVSLYFCVVLTDQTASYFKKTADFREYNETLRAVILTEGDPGEEKAAALFSSCITDHTSCLLYPTEAGAFNIICAYQREWYVPYCRSEAGLSPIAEG